MLKCWHFHSRRFHECCFKNTLFMSVLVCNNSRLICLNSFWCKKRRKKSWTAHKYCTLLTRGTSIIWWNKGNNLFFVRRKPCYYFELFSLCIISCIKFDNCCCMRMSRWLFFSWHVWKSVTFVLAILLNYVQFSLISHAWCETVHDGHLS